MLLSPEPVFTLATVRVTWSDAIVRWDKSHPVRSGLEGLRKLGSGPEQGAWALCGRRQGIGEPQACISQLVSPGHVGVDCGAAAT